MRFFSTTAAVLCFAALHFTVSGPAQARVEEPLEYTKVQSYRAALRFLRVDNGYNIVEKDSDSGYLLFEYPDTNEGVTMGSIEVIEREESVAVVVQLPKMPSYHEQHLIAGLLKKLRTDYGDPPRREKPDAKKPEQDPPKGQPDSKEGDSEAPPPPEKEPGR